MSEGTERSVRLSGIVRRPRGSPSSARGGCAAWRRGAVVLAGAAMLLLVARRGVVLTPAVAGAVGVAVGLLGGPLPT